VAYLRLERASALERLEPARQFGVAAETVRLDFELPRHAVSLILLTPA
jgi:hypothetical protein